MQNDTFHRANQVAHVRQKPVQNCFLEARVRARLTWLPTTDPHLSCRHLWAQRSSLPLEPIKVSVSLGLGSRPPGRRTGTLLKSVWEGPDWAQVRHVSGQVLGADPEVGVRCSDLLRSTHPPPAQENREEAGAGLSLGKAGQLCSNGSCRLVHWSCPQGLPRHLSIEWGHSAPTLGLQWTEHSLAEGGPPWVGDQVQGAALW